MTTDNCEHIQTVAQYLNGTLAAPDAVEFDDAHRQLRGLHSGTFANTGFGAEPDWAETAEITGNRSTACFHRKRVQIPRRDTAKFESQVRGACRLSGKAGTEQPSKR
jgi:hypothetical protein